MAETGRLEIGDGCRAGEGTVIVVGPGAVVVLGAGAQLGDGCRLVAHERIVLGTGVRLQDGVAVIDFDHVIDDVERPIRHQGLVTAPVLVGEHAVLERACSVLRGVTVGPRASVAPHAVVTRDVPAGARVAGAPAVR